MPITKVMWWARHGECGHYRGSVVGTTWALSCLPGQMCNADYLYRAHDEGSVVGTT